MTNAKPKEVNLSNTDVFFVFADNPNQWSISAINLYKTVWFTNNYVRMAWKKPKWLLMNEINLAEVKFDLEPQRITDFT